MPLLQRNSPKLAEASVPEKTMRIKMFNSIYVKWPHFHLRSPLLNSAISTRYASLNYHHKHWFHRRWCVPFCVSSWWSKREPTGCILNLNMLCKLKEKYSLNQKKSNFIKVVMSFSLRTVKMRDSIFFSLSLKTQSLRIISFLALFLDDGGIWPFSLLLLFSFQRQNTTA